MKKLFIFGVATFLIGSIVNKKMKDVSLEDGLASPSLLFSKEQTFDSKISEIRSKVLTSGVDENQKLCQRQSHLIKSYVEDLSWRELTYEQKKEYSLKVLKFSHQMANELARYTFKNNTDLLHGSKADPSFVLELAELQRPCRNQPQAINQLIHTISKNIENNQRENNWMVYRMAEVSMSFVKKLDSFEAYHASLDMMDTLGKSGHLNEEDTLKIRKLKVKVRDLSNDFQREVLASTEKEQNLNEIFHYWENQKFLTKMEIKRYLTDVSRRYPTQDSRFGKITLPEII